MISEPTKTTRHPLYWPVAYATGAIYSAAAAVMLWAYLETFWR